MNLESFASTIMSLHQHETKPKSHNKIQKRLQVKDGVNKMIIVYRSQFVALNDKR